MTKIWAKIMINHRVTKSIIYDCGGTLITDNFYNAVREICDELKIPTPIVLQSYAQHFVEYRIFKFKQRDFLEEIPFDFLVLENGE